MRRAAVAMLEELGYSCTLAWYEPYSWTPRLSVPFVRLGSRRVGAETRVVDGAREGRALGAWLPELEFTHYWPTARWRRLIADHDVHLAVTGNCLAGLPFARTGVPFLAWIASDWHGDRKDRVARFPFARRLLDRLVTRPTVGRLEPSILRRGRILALSEPTRRALDRAAGSEVVRGVLPCPIDVDRFSPEPAAVVPGRVGFVGRLDDPRKNFSLFLAVLEQARAIQPSIHALVVGGELSAAQRLALASRGLSGAVEIHPYVEPPRLASLLRTLDVLAVTSHQEGLGIAFLEAMACGAPVVSTRCGGPEEYLEGGGNGELVDSGEEFARQLAAIVQDRERRGRLGERARRTVLETYAWPRVREIFVRELAATGWRRADPTGGVGR